MKRLLFPLVLVFGFAGISCDEEDDNMDSGNSTDNVDAGDDDDDDDDDDDSMEESSMEECNTSHACINDVCECTTPGKEEEPCTDDELCVDECEVCM